MSSELFIYSYNNKIDNYMLNIILKVMHSGKNSEFRS